MKFVHQNGLRLNSSSETGYGFFSFLKEQKAPVLAGALLRLSVSLSIAGWGLVAPDIWFVLIDLNDLS